MLKTVNTLKKFVPLEYAHYSRAFSQLHKQGAGTSPHPHLQPRHTAIGSLVIRDHLGNWHLQVYAFSLSLVVLMLVLNIRVHEEGSFLLHVKHWDEVRRPCPSRTGISALGQNF